MRLAAYRDGASPAEMRQAIDQVWNLANTSVVPRFFT